MIKEKLYRKILSIEFFIIFQFVVNFKSDSLGTVNPLKCTMINGKASAVFTAGSSPGTSQISATVDNQTVKTNIEIR